MFEDLLTLKQAKKELNGVISLSSLYLAIQTKSLPHYRVSGNRARGKILVRRADLLAWLEGQKVETGTAEDDEPLRHLH